MNRRGVVLGIGGGIAAAAGLGAGVLVPRLRRDPDADAASVDPWTMSFARPDGKAIVLATLRGRPLLLNFWATWCGPCATEMPLLDRFARSPRAVAWNVLALAIDDAEPVRRFVAERSLRLPVALAGVDGIDVSRTLGNAAGALPFTVVFDRRGNPVERTLGILDDAMIDRWAAAYS